jgi:hypothetical protein
MLPDSDGLNALIAAATPGPWRKESGSHPATVGGWQLVAE